jgi:uncharacterized protein YbjT (DUF2867 family)
MTTFLILGGTGKTGRRVADRLRARGLAVRAVSRSTEPPFDWFDETTWGPVLDGEIEAAYLTFHPDLALPGADDRIRAFSTLAAAKGVRRLVLLSGRGEPETEPSERAVAESGTGWTIVRCAWFAQNFSEDFLFPPTLAGDLALPAGSVGEPFVDVDDVADVVVETLVSTGHDGREYELTGPRLLTFADAAAEISAASGREVRNRRVSAEEFAAMSELPAEVAGALAEMFERVLDGRNEHVSGDVERVLGRPARDFAEYAKSAADAWGR